MKMLVTGGAGFMGSHVVDLLIENKHEVAVIDHNLERKRDNTNAHARYYETNLCDFSEVAKVFQKESPEVVYHFAGQTNIRRSVDSPLEDAQVNIMATLNILELCAKGNVKHFIFSSSGSAVYGNPESETLPNKENTAEDPMCPYGCAKLAIEKYLRFYNKIHGLKSTIIRYSTIYGPRQDPSGGAGVVAIFLRSLFREENPSIFGGIQTRDFIYVKDAARANLAVLNDDESSTYNVSTGKETDIIEIFNRINSYFGGKFKPEYARLKRGEHNRSCLSYEKIKKKLGWRPLTTLEEGLDETYGWFLRNYKKRGKAWLE